MQGIDGPLGAGLQGELISHYFADPAADQEKAQDDSSALKNSSRGDCGVLSWEVRTSFEESRKFG